jgi:hypothetical protein
MAVETKPEIAIVDFGLPELSGRDLTVMTLTGASSLPLNSLTPAFLQRLGLAVRLVVREI